MSKEHGLVGYSQEPVGPFGESAEEAAQEEYNAIKPRAEERANDARKPSGDASNSAYGPNQRSKAFRKGQEVSEHVGRENFAQQAKSVPDSAYRPENISSESSKGTHEYGREVPPSINPSNKEQNPGDYYGSTGGY
ncbi:hypothetical protein ABW19_dt0207064 [Dactylella cylindrospora]|nr:hypothetical protein ABW19_dt0207064 [Dactylella cylindrospora]